MAKLFCRLSQMPVDEKLDVVEMLEQAGIHFYETQAGFWGVGVAALWLSDPEQFDEAQQMYDDYQVKRQHSSLEDYQPQQTPVGLWQRFCQQPLLFSVSLMVIAVILSLSIYPFML